jgi:hypothetical protein
MSRQEVNIGVVGNDGSGDSIREAFRKVNDNFKELYAVFNQGDFISFQDLGNVTVNNVDTVITTIDTGSGLSIKDRRIDGGTSISVEFTDDKILLRALGTSLDSDEKPNLAGALNGKGYPLANVAAPSQLAVDIFNSTHPGISIGLNDIVITKGYGDQNYLRKTGGSSSGEGQIRVRDEPVATNAYYLDITGNINNNAIVNNHGFDAGFDGAAYNYFTGGVPASNLAMVIDVTNSTHFKIGRSYKIEQLGNLDFTLLGAKRNKVGEIFILDKTSPINGYGAVVNLEGGSPSSVITTVIDGGAPNTTVFNNTINGGGVSEAVGISTGLIRPIYFLKVVNVDQLSIHPTYKDALYNTNKLPYNGGSGFQRLVDAYYDSKLEGNWLSNEVLSRKNVVRRQGDKMDGVLMLYDHPFPLNGAGSPNSPDDLQAATKYYVDNSSFASAVNLFVSNKGKDEQLETPVGKEGRAWAYAFSSISKACEVAEYLMNNAAFETGPYRQFISISRIIDNATETTLSVVTSYTAPGLNGLARLKFSNNNGAPVDQGTNPTTEIIAGKLIKGRSSGATGIILNYSTDGASLLGEDYVDLQQVNGEFLLGENVEFGDPTNNLHITIHVESGIYEEDYPIKLPANTAIVGDEFRRVLVRPKDRISRSPWVYTWFFRNSRFDSISITTSGTYFDDKNEGWYGFHYLKQSNKPINRGLSYPNIGNYINIANTISTNKTQIQNEVIDFLESDGNTLLNPIVESKCRRDTGYILDAITSDLKTGGIQKIYDIQESFYGVILDPRCIQGLLYIATYINTTIISSADSTVKTLITNMVEKILFALDPNYNTPKNNKDIDVFLCNDTTIIRQITCQGHGGFMMVLDPEGQILSKSPYCQQSGSFSASINTKAFRGGQYIDGFSGNLTATVLAKINDTQIKISGIPRAPLMPTSFFIDGNRYKVDNFKPEDGADINARDLIIANKLFIQAQTLNHINNEFPLIKYSIEEFQRIINRFINGVRFDISVGGNSQTLSAIRRLFDPSTEELRFAVSLKPLLIKMIEYIRDTCSAIIINQTVTPNQNLIEQVKIIGRPGISGTQININTLLNDARDTITLGIDSANSLANPTFVLVLDTATPFTTNLPPKITLVTPGNTSMLSNDFTQVNDLGYGIVTNNNGLAECVSVFSYYCWTSMFSDNGGQIRSLNSSSANGEYGLVAQGSDPLEVADVVYLADHTIQIAKIVKRNTGTNDFSNTGLEKSLFIYVEGYSYFPYNISIVEINHGPTVGIFRYEMNNISLIEPGIIRLNFNTSGNNDTSTSGLGAAVLDGDKVIIRSGQNFKFNNVLDTNPVRPSTALTLLGDSANDINAPVYRVIAYGVRSPNNELLNANEAILSFDTTFNYIQLIVNKNKIGIVDPNNAAKTLGSKVGDTKIAILKITSTITVNRLLTGQMLTAWDGKVHRITDYTAPSGENYAYITISDTLSDGQTLQNLNTPIISGLQSSLDPSALGSTLRADSDIVLRAGLAKNEEANIVVRISTLRATGHDFLDIGTGGYNTSNYPSKIYGNPKDANQAREVEERTRGRVFYVSTDQDGFFRVGRFFTVDQGTGTVTFSASIALSNLDGIGFKRGISISEFSSDDQFVDLASDTVPTEAAISGYIDRRLGVDRNGFYLDISETYPAVPGFLARNANTPIKGPTTDISWAGKRLIDLGLPIALNDATNKKYVDTEIDGYANLKQLRDVLTTTSSPGEILMFTSSSGEAVSASINGDIEATLNSGIKSSLKEEILSTGSVSSINITNASEFPNQGFVLIDLEIFQYNGKTSSGTAQQLDGITRLSISGNNRLKFRSLQAAAHAINATVYSLETAQIELQIKAGVITNSDINADAQIQQSKLVLNLSTTSAEAPTGTNSYKQSISGLSTFDSSNFEVIDGWVKVKDGGISRLEQENIGTNILLGNLDRVTSIYPQEVAPKDILRRASYDLLQPLSTIGQDHVLTFKLASTEATSSFLSTNVNINVSSNSIVKRTAFGHLKISNLDSNGNVSIISISGTIILSGVTFSNGEFNCDSTTLVEGGRINISGVNSGDLSLPSYNSSGTNFFIIATNGSTRFKLSSTLNGSPINTTGSTISGLTFVNQTGTADNSTPITYKGQWSPGNAATFRATSADIWTNTRTITVTGDASGSISLDGSSDKNLELDVGYATSAGSAGYVHNKLTFNNSGEGGDSGTTYDGATAKIISYNTIGAASVDGANAIGSWPINISGNAGSANTAGTAGSITNQANSATITATSANTANRIVLRDESGNFSAGTIQCATLTTGNATTTGTITGAWSLTNGSSLQATYADLAEFYSSDKDYEVGTVLIFGGSAETTVTNIFGDTRVAGVVTTNPAYVMNKGLEGTRACLALQGRVPCKVVGKVSKGDLLTTSANPGHAIRATNPTVGSIIGKALEDKDSYEFGFIEIAVGRS